MLMYVKEKGGVAPVVPPGHAATVTDRGLEAVKVRKRWGFLSAIVRLFTRRK